MENETYRICFLGSSFSGKTTIINNLVNNNFIENYTPTYNVEEYFTEYILDYKENMLLKGLHKFSDTVNLIIEDW